MTKEKRFCKATNELITLVTCNRRKKGRDYNTDKRKPPRQTIKRSRIILVKNLCVKCDEKKR